MLVVDAGTSAVRCHLFHPSAGIVVSSASPWVYTQEAGASELARAFNPQAVWRGVSNAISRCLAGRRVSAVAITSQRQALAFLDADGNEIYVGPNVDLRAVFEGAELDEIHRDRIYGTTGHTPAFMLAAGKLRWFQIHQPDVYARIASVISLADWLAFKLSGEIASERTLAAEAGMLDLESGRRAEDLYLDLGMPL
ncbi:MAG: FGGY family carbohydrate kinase, partial [SAR202 cluster bacterium]|nr:FGGY family carbohydrate kinase [SAR202 cluster bacterium]